MSGAYHPSPEQYQENNKSIALPLALELLGIQMHTIGRYLDSRFNEPPHLTRNAEVDTVMDALAQARLCYKMLEALTGKDK